MDWKKKWLAKAKEHFKAGELLYEQSLYRDSIARLYYSAYSLMVAECGEPPKGRWSHKGIIKNFQKRIYEKGIYLSKDIKEHLSDLYERRRLADYEIITIEKVEVELYIYIVKELMEVVENG